MRRLGKEDRAGTLCKDKKGATQRFRADFKLNTRIRDNEM